jgi:hypothetical protein
MRFPVHIWQLESISWQASNIADRRLYMEMNSLNDLSDIFQSKLRLMIISALLTEKTFKEIKEMNRMHSKKGVIDYDES